ncbi:MAG TPA: hypothetical protein VE618_06715 [Myxococcaceae bacterium]|nr:hypothetical protein [Myxococcaceae bacterium]
MHYGIARWIHGSRRTIVRLLGRSQPAVEHLRRYEIAAEFSAS